jgi:translation initiation factor 3 subunit C
MIQRQQNVGEPIPPFFIRTITDLEISINDAQSKDAKKKMNATNARAFTAMKQKVKKTLKDFEKEVKQYQAVRLTTGMTTKFFLTSRPMLGS